MPFVKKDGPVILNGADYEIFNNKSEEGAQPKEGSPQFMYVRYNRDETKQWHVAWYSYQMAQRKYPDAHLWIIGQFSPEQIKYNFDFFMGEKYRYVGVLDNPIDLAEYYRGADDLLVPYYMDACSNVMIEALLCGTAINYDRGNCDSADEIAAAYEKDYKLLTAEHMTNQYIRQFARLL